MLEHSGISEKQALINLKTRDRAISFSGRKILKKLGFF
jgi:hypothetical protein